MKNLRPEITSRVSTRALPRQRKQLPRWVPDVFLQIPSVFAVLILFLEVAQECLAIEERLKIECQIPAL